MQGQGALASSPGTCTAAPATDAGARPSPASSRAGADSSAASQSMIPLTVAQRAKAAAAAMGAHSNLTVSARRDLSTDGRTCVFPSCLRCRWWQITEDPQGSGHLAGRVEGQERAVRWRRAKRGGSSRVCRCCMLRLYTDALTAASVVVANAEHERFCDCRWHCQTARSVPVQ